MTKCFTNVHSFSPHHSVLQGRKPRLRIPVYVRNWGAGIRNKTTQLQRRVPQVRAHMPPLAQPGTLTQPQGASGPSKAVES